MKKKNLALTCLLLLGTATAQAQINVQIDIGLPPAPPLVVIQPGVQVVEGFQEEVFFDRGWYWCRRPDGWYRAHTPHERFEWVEVHRVPRALVRIPPGHYRNWHHDEAKFHENRGRKYGHYKRVEPGPEQPGFEKGHGKGRGKHPYPPPPPAP